MKWVKTQDEMHPGTCHVEDRDGNSWWVCDFHRDLAVNDFDWAPLPEGPR